jgi:hypothetical protein
LERPWQPGCNYDAKDPNRAEELFPDFGCSARQQDQPPARDQWEESEQLGSEVVNRPVAAAQLIVSATEVVEAVGVSQFGPPVQGSKTCKPTTFEASILLETMVL